MDASAADGPLLVSRCACGWESIGTADQVVAATQDHGLRVHNMNASREDVLARAAPLEAPRPTTAGHDARDPR